MQNKTNQWTYRPAAFNEAKPVRSEAYTAERTAFLLAISDNPFARGTIEHMCRHSELVKSFYEAKRKK